jgi:hypothetical protein
MQTHILRVLATAAFLIGSATGLTAQPPSQDQPPIEVELITLRVPEGQERFWRVKNVSQKDVSAYVACVPNETGLCTLTHATVYVMAPAPRNRLRPGETREEPRAKIIGAAPTNPVVRATVDWVLFADGSAWGPDTRKQSLWIRGVIYGAQGTLARLKRLLDTQGTNAVIEEILRTSQEP